MVLRCLGSLVTVPGKFVSVSGFGNLNLTGHVWCCKASDVGLHEIDYSRVSSATKDDSPHDSGSGDPVAEAHQADELLARTANPERMWRGGRPHTGKEGEDNGVQVRI